MYDNNENMAFFHFNFFFGINKEDKMKIREKVILKTGS